MGAWLFDQGVTVPWLIQLGPRGPWLVERLLSAREMTAELDTAGKVDVVTESVLRACSPPGGEVNVDLHNHVCSIITSWASDGADLSVGDALTARYPSMVFREWDGSHSANKVLEKAIKNHREGCVVDGLLVSGSAAAPNLRRARKAPSLAKFLSQSLVFRKRCTEAQRAAGVALCSNFGYAPQRYASRARPLSAEQRRWEPIWDSLAEEAAGNSDRATLARYFLEELGGTNSHRLLFGGMLADVQ